MPSTQHIRKQYEQGKLADGELFWLLMRTVDEDVMAELVGWVPLKLLEQVEAYVRYCPHTEEHWAGLLRHESENTEGVIANPVTRRAVEMLRDLIGPYPPRSIAPAVLAWNDACVANLACAIHDERAFDRLPILGDALEEAGCTDAEFLAHLRGPGPHFRGCWGLALCCRRNKP